VGWIRERGISRKRMGTCRFIKILELSELRPQKQKAIKRQAKIFFQNEKEKREKRQTQHLKNNGK
jgi:hypothetical protein